MTSSRSHTAAPAPSRPPGPTDIPGAGPLYQVMNDGSGRDQQIDRLDDPVMNTVRKGGTAAGRTRTGSLQVRAGGDQRPYHLWLAVAGGRDERCPLIR